MKKFAFTLMELMLIFFILAIIAILFYRTLKPDRIVFQKLYSSAYSQMEEAYKEVTSNIELDENFLENYPENFSKIVNQIGAVSTGDLNRKNADYNEDDAYYQIFDNMDNIIFPMHLSNNMQIRFDLVTSQDNASNDIQVLIATMDINGDALPNLMNKDIIQFEITRNGILPVGDIETNVNLLKYSVLTRKTGEVNVFNPKAEMGEERALMSGLSYDVAACYAGVPRHTFYNNKECGAINELPDCQYNELPCRVKVLKY